MSRPALRGLALAALAALALLAGCGEEPLAPLTGWAEDYPAAARRAGEQKQSLAILFSAPWSPVARRFEAEVLPDPRVAAELDRFVRVRLDLDRSKELAAELEVTGVPSLVLVNPAGERKSVPGSWRRGQEPDGREKFCTALAEFLGTLGPWEELPGWEGDRAAAEKRSAESGKPLAVLYSAAWEPRAVAFEKGPLSDQRVKEALAGFTLLRLNLAACPARAKAEEVEAAPALVLPAAGGFQTLPEACSTEALLGFIDSLGGWKPAPGWSSDYQAAARRAKDEQKPLAVVLDRAPHWLSLKFLHEVLGSDQVAKGLEPFVKVRLEHSSVPKETRKAWQVSDPPCLVLFKPDGRLHGSCGAKGATDKLAGKIAESLKLAAAAPEATP